jgi:hypothetical protein
MGAKVTFKELSCIMVDADLKAMEIASPGEGKRILMEKFGIWHHWHKAVTKAIEASEGKALE